MNYFPPRRGNAPPQQQQRSQQQVPPRGREMFGPPPPRERMDPRGRPPQGGQRIFAPRNVLHALIGQSKRRCGDYVNMMRKFGEGMQQLHAECDHMAGEAGGDEVLLAFLQNRLEQARFIAEHTKRHLDAQIQYELRFQDALQRWIDGHAPVDYGFPSLRTRSPGGEPPRLPQRTVDDEEPVEHHETRRGAPAPVAQRPLRPEPRREPRPEPVRAAPPARQPLRAAPSLKEPSNGARAPKEEERAAPPLGAMLHSIYSSYSPRAEESSLSSHEGEAHHEADRDADHDAEASEISHDNSKSNGPSAPAAPASSDDVVG